jgi:hypothetical protein
VSFRDCSCVVRDCEVDPVSLASYSATYAMHVQQKLNEVPGDENLDADELMSKNVQAYFEEIEKKKRAAAGIPSSNGKLGYERARSPEEEISAMPADAGRLAPHFQ